MKLTVQLTFGFVVAVLLVVAAVWLWAHNLIIFAAPVGALAIGVGWVTVDNTLIYPAQKQRRAAEATPTDAPAPDAAAEANDVTVHRSPT